VLPSLGEHEVQLSTVTALRHGLRVTRLEDPATAVVKGDVRMATVVKRALADRERPLPRDLVVPIDGFRLRLTRRDCARLLERVRRKRGTHNARRPLVERALTEHLVRQYRDALAHTHDDVLDVVEQQLLDANTGEDAPEPTASDHYDPFLAARLARGENPPPEWEREIGRRIRRRPEVKAALERMWPVLTGAELVHDLFSFEALIHSAADSVLKRADQKLLHRPRAAGVRDVPWTDADVALIDEADALLGPVEAARPRRSRRASAEGRAALDTARRVVEEMGLGGFTNAETLAARFGDGNGRRDATIPELRTFGHVVVDEAQDLSPMQWRMLARRCPTGSMTIVGDFGQASRPGCARDWDQVLEQLPRRDQPRVVTLTLNYRTPSEIMDLANRLLAAAAPEVEATRSVRSTGDQPSFRHVEDVVPAAARAARDATRRGGTIAVIAPEPLHDAIVAALADEGAVADSPEALDAPIGVLGALDAKGLEFDHVVVVEPADLVTPDESGLRLLYVTLTRATRTLTVVHRGALPEALAP
jgi:hypothetical protein